YRSYVGILSSSLTIILLIALVLSTCPPVSVSGTGNISPGADAFLDSIGSPNHPPRGCPSRLRHTSGGFANQTPYTLRPGLFHCLARLPSCVTPVNALDSLVQVPRSPHQHTRKRTDTARVVSITS